MSSLNLSFYYEEKSVREHGGAAGKNDVGVEILTDIDIALHDGLERKVRDTGGFFAQNAILQRQC